MKRLNDYFNGGEPIEWASLWGALILLAIFGPAIVARWLG